MYQYVAPQAQEFNNELTNTLEWLLGNLQCIGFPQGPIGNLDDYIRQLEVAGYRVLTREKGAILEKLVGEREVGEDVLRLIDRVIGTFTHWHSRYLIDGDTIEYVHRIVSIPNARCVVVIELDLAGERLAVWDRVVVDA